MSKILSYLLDRVKKKLYVFGIQFAVHAVEIYVVVAYAVHFVKFH